MQTATLVDSKNTYVDQVVLAALSGLTLSEVSWMYRRLKALDAAGKSRQEARLIVMQEALDRPWTRQ